MHTNLALRLVRTAAATAHTEDFELVAVLVGQTLTLTLDHFATNAPVLDAQIEVESGSALKAVAQQVAPGVYALQSALFSVPGSYPLTFSVQAGDSADLLAATLNLPSSAPSALPASALSSWAVPGGAGALLLAGAVVVAVQQRKKHLRQCKA